MIEVLPGLWVEAANLRITQIHQRGRRLNVEFRMSFDEYRTHSHKFYDWTDARAWAEKLRQ